MRRRQLGSTDIYVSELGFGAWGIGGRTEGPTSYGDTDDNVSLRALRHALASGITFFDTSNVYGAGHSEVLLGRAFRTDRANVVIATKAGWPSYTEVSDFSYHGIRQSLEGSLRRLQSDYVDLLQLHNPPLDWRESHPHIPAMLRELVAEGKIRAAGVSVRFPEEAAAFIELPEIAAIQANFNMMDTRAVLSDLLSRLIERRQSLIARTPLCFGFLSGIINRSTAFAAGDHRSAWSIAQRERWIEGSEIFAAMIQRYGVGPLYDAAIRFCLSFTGVATVLSGMLTEAEVSQNAAAAVKGALPESIVQEVIELNRNIDFFVSDSTGGRSRAAVLVKR